MARPERNGSSIYFRCLLSWRVRCLIAWICRIFGLASAILTMLSFVYWYTLDPDGFDRVFALGPAGIAVCSFGAFGLWELIGRLLSWTSPWKALPRFDDGPDDAGRNDRG